MASTPRATGSQAGPGKKTGPKPSFSREDVIDAALELGISDFTLSAVARKLGVVTAALYRVFPSRDAVLDACLARAAATIRTPDPEAPWQDALHLWASECWRLCEQFPGLSRTLFTFPAAASHIEGTLEVYAHALERHGKSRSQAAFALDFIGDTVMAFGLGKESMQSTDDSGTTGLDQVLDRMGEEHLFQPDESWADRGFTDVKVNFIIDGLERNWPEI